MLLDDLDFWLLIALVAAAFFQLGRMSMRGEGDGAPDRRLQDDLDASMSYSALSPALQTDIDGLVLDGRAHEAVGRLRAETDIDAQRARAVVDRRRRSLSA